MAMHEIAIIVGSLRKGQLQSQDRALDLRVSRRHPRLLDGRDRRPAALQPGFRRDPQREEYVRFRDQIAAPTASCSLPRNITAVCPASSRTRSTLVRGPTAKACGTRSPRQWSPRHPADWRVRRQPPAPPVVRVPQHAGDAAARGLSVNVSDEVFDDDGCLKDGKIKQFVATIAHAFHDWVDMVHRSRSLLAEDVAHLKGGKEQAQPCR